MGHLCADRAGDGLVPVQPQRRWSDQRHAAADHRPPPSRLDRKGGQHLRRGRHGGRRGHGTGFRHGADRRRRRTGVRAARRHTAAADHHRSGVRAVHGLVAERRRAWHEVAFQRQSGPGGIAAGTGAGARPDRRHLQYLHHHAGFLPQPVGDHEPAHVAVLVQHLGSGLDDLLLGMVDFVGTVRRFLHRAHLARPQCSRVRGGSGACAHPAGLLLVLGLRWHRDLVADLRPRRSGAGTGQWL
ncbi:hypothetical protein D3C71_1471010 [compost metagenome]